MQWCVGEGRVGEETARRRVVCVWEGVCVGCGGGGESAGCVWAGSGVKGKMQAKQNDREARRDRR